MPPCTLNLGILAHVDAGKTTLSERLLHATGAIGEMGRVDDGTTRTDSLALERRRGITIRSAVVSFTVCDTPVNLIDTPGHPDFIAEVDRVLGVLDGAVLVVSAVEGVQPQTRVLMRALRRLAVPTLLFVNKVDRCGADVERVLAQIRRRLDVPAVSMSRVRHPGTPGAEAVALDDEAFAAAAIESLTVVDDALLAAYVTEPEAVTADRLRTVLVVQTRQAQVHPVFAGSAVTGTGIGALMDGLVELLPAAAGDLGAPFSAGIFKIERAPSGEKVAYARVFAGMLRTRDRPAHPEDRVTAVEVFADGAWTRRDAVRAGEIGKLWGLHHAQVGGVLGVPPRRVDHQFAPPALEAVVEPVHVDDNVPLRTALAQLAEQDPLIDVRDSADGPAVSLYGEVQKEVVAATLADDFGIPVTFREATPLLVERPAGAGEAVELLNAPSNPFRATVGLRIEPGPLESGNAVRVPVDHRTMPLYAYRTSGEFAAAVERYVRDALAEGRHGWPVVDCVVTMTACNYSVADGPPSQRGPTTTAADFRKLTPLVVAAALDDAGVVVCAPLARVRVDAPAETLGSVLAGLARLGAAVQAHEARGDDVTVEALLPAADVRVLHAALPGLTNGEGVLESSPAGYRPVRGTPPVRRQTGGSRVGT